MLPFTLEDGRILRRPAAAAHRLPLHLQLSRRPSQRSLEAAAAHQLQQMVRGVRQQQHITCVYIKHISFHVKRLQHTNCSSWKLAAVSRRPAAAVHRLLPLLPLTRLAAAAHQLRIRHVRPPAAPHQLTGSRTSIASMSSSISGSSASTIT